MKIVNTYILEWIKLKKSEVNRDICIDLGHKFISCLTNLIVFNIDNTKAITNDFALGGIVSPILIPTKESTSGILSAKTAINYTNSSILFTGHLTQDCKLIKKTLLTGTLEDLKEIKILAGGVKQLFYSDEVYPNLVLKVKGICKMISNDDDIVYQINNKNKNKDYITIDLFKLISLSNNIYTSRMLISNKIYRHYPSKRWYKFNRIVTISNKTYVQCQELFAQKEIHLIPFDDFLAEVEKKDRIITYDNHTIQDYYYMTIEQLENQLGHKSKEYIMLLTDYYDIINNNAELINN
ncbi:TPA: hypothetical protein KQG29_001555 [Clostridioides difficile]|nr:hypothetical protein [Clostridioides difficile]